MTKELEAVRLARQRRARLGRPLLIVTVSVVLTVSALFLVVPGFSPFGRKASEIGQPIVVTASARSGEGPEVSAEPVVRIHGGVISLDGVPLAKTEGIDKVERVVPLYDALKLRRQGGSAPTSKRLLLSVDAAERAVVVKSVFQTAVFAGYSDVAFSLPEGTTAAPAP